jgi:hypothetical protein
LSIINSIAFGMGTLPEAKIGPLKRMAKREMDSCRLYALAFNYPERCGRYSSDYYFKINKKF